MSAGEVSTCAVSYHLTVTSWDDQHCPQLSTIPWWQQTPNVLGPHDSRFALGVGGDRQGIQGNSWNDKIRLTKCSKSRWHPLVAEVREWSTPRLLIWKAQDDEHPCGANLRGHWPMNPIPYVTSNPVTWKTVSDRLTLVWAESAAGHWSSTGQGPQQQYRRPWTFLGLPK